MENKQKLRSRRIDIIVVVIMIMILNLGLILLINVKNSKWTRTDKLIYDRIINKINLSYINGTKIDYNGLNYSAPIEEKMKRLKEKTQYHSVYVMEVIENSFLPSNYGSNYGDDFKSIWEEYILLFQINYTTDIDNFKVVEYIQTPQELVRNSLKGDCDDYAIFLYTIAKNHNIPVRYMVGWRESFGHAWVQVEIDNIWYEYDSTGNNVCEVEKKCISENYDFIGYVENSKIVLK